MLVNTWVVKEKGIQRKLEFSADRAPEIAKRLSLGRKVGMT